MNMKKLSNNDCFTMSQTLKNLGLREALLKKIAQFEELVKY